MTDQDSAAVDQSNHAEDVHRENVEHVERTDVGVSLTVKLKRGTGTRDQDEVIAKTKGSTLEDAREDMKMHYTRTRSSTSIETCVVV